MFGMNRRLYADTPKELLLSITSTVINLPLLLRYRNKAGILTLGAVYTSIAVIKKV